jgi:hypothetical protein
MSMYVILTIHYVLFPKKFYILLVGVWVYRGMVSIEDFKLAMVVVLVLLTLPICFDGWEGCAAVSARVAVGHWLRCPCLAVEDAGIAIIKEHIKSTGAQRPTYAGGRQCGRRRWRRR